MFLRSATIPRLASPLLLASIVFGRGWLTAAELSAEKSDGKVTIKIDGRLFTEYLVKSGAKPVLWPLIGPGGKPVTRSYPLETVAGEEQDHVHQRSCWFTHGRVNGVDFWSEQDGHGTIEHREFTKLAGGATALVVARNDWRGPDGKKVCEDERTLTFGGDAETRWFDFDIAIKASEGEVTFGDTKEGCFGMRVASSIRVMSKLGGRIVNSEAQADDAAWGKPARWVDYQGPVAGEKVGIAIFNHPASFRYPTYWHVRTYGLFAANPFGVKDFTGSGDGAYKLPAGESLRLYYRVLLHRGDEREAKLADAFDAYSKTAKP